MDKLQVFICENFYPEYQAALEKEGVDDLALCVHPTLCDHKGKKTQVKELLAKADKNNSILVCNRNCEAKKLLNEDHSIETVTRNYCFTHLTTDEFLDYLTAQGSYIVSLGWLKQWKSHLAGMGFDQETARTFFQETSKQIVFLDAKIDDKSEDLLQELSSYLGIPYLIITVELDTIRLLLKSKLYEWRLHHENIKNTKAIRELRSQTADYSAAFNMLGEIWSYTSKRDVIDKVKNLFMMVFGAQNFRFWSEDSKLMPPEVIVFQSNNDPYVMLQNENRFCIKVLWKDQIFGIVDVSDFLFPQYIDRYLNMALDITKFLGLVLHDNEQYEKIVDSEKKMKYLSFHDSMTGLYNRTYINQHLSDKVKDDNTIVFMFDIDKLKYVNDNFGHAAGDELISRFSDVIKECFREIDIVARTGGDEFIAIIYDGDKEAGNNIKRRIFELITMNNENLKNEYLTLSVSIGYAMPSKNNETIEDLMKKADAMMYKNKMGKRLLENS